MDTIDTPDPDDYSTGDLPLAELVSRITTAIISLATELHVTRSLVGLETGDEALEGIRSYADTLGIEVTFVEEQPPPSMN